MSDRQVADIMSTDLITIRSDQDVKEVAGILAEKRIGGAPVVEEGRLIGMVTEDDLIMKDVKLHFPTFIHLLDGFIYLGSTKRFEEQFRKMIGAKVKDVMNTEIISITPHASVTEAATKMIEEKLDRLPVIGEEGQLMGIVTKADIVKAIASENV